MYIRTTPKVDHWAQVSTAVGRGTHTASKPQTPDKVDLELSCLGRPSRQWPKRAGGGERARIAAVARSGPTQAVLLAALAASKFQTSRKLVAGLGYIMRKPLQAVPAQGLQVATRAPSRLPWRAKG